MELATNVLEQLMEEQHLTPELATNVLEQLMEEQGTSTRTTNRAATSHHWPFWEQLHGGQLLTSTTDSVCCAHLDSSIASLTEHMYPAHTVQFEPAHAVYRKRALTGKLNHAT